MLGRLHWRSISPPPRLPVPASRARQPGSRRLSFSAAFRLRLLIYGFVRSITSPLFIFQPPSRMTGHEVDDEPEARARMERRQVLTATAAAAEAGTLLGKSVAADVSISDDSKAAGSKETRKREVDTDGEESSPRLSCLVHAASSTAVEAGESSGVVVQAKGSATGLPSPLTKQMKKKLLILDLNGLLADINQDRHNAHLSHGTIRGKLGTYVNQISC